MSWVQPCSPVVATAAAKPIENKKELLPAPSRIGRDVWGPLPQDWYQTRKATSWSGQTVRKEDNLAGRNRRSSWDDLYLITYPTNDKQEDNQHTHTHTRTYIHSNSIYHNKQNTQRPMDGQLSLPHQKDGLQECHVTCPLSSLCQPTMYALDTGSTINSSNNLPALFSLSPLFFPFIQFFLSFSRSHSLSLNCY